MSSDPLDAIISWAKSAIDRGEMQAAARVLDSALIIAPYSVKATELFLEAIGRPDAPTAKITPPSAAVGSEDRRAWLEMVQAARQALRHDPDDPGLLKMMATALHRLDHDRAAIATLNRVIALDPSDAEAHFLQAQSFADLGAYYNAATAAEQALRLQPDNRRYENAYVMYLEKREEGREGIEYVSFERLLDMLQVHEEEVTRLISEGRLQTYRDRDDESKIRIAVQDLTRLKQTNPAALDADLTAAIESLGSLDRPLEAEADPTATPNAATRTEPKAEDRTSPGGLSFDDVGAPADDDEEDWDNLPAPAEPRPYERRTVEPIGKRIGQILKQIKDDLTEGHVQDALVLQKKHGGALGQVLIKMKLVDHDDVLRALCMQRGIDIVDLDLIEIAPEVLERVPDNVARQFTLLPLLFADDALTVAIADPTNEMALDDLRLALNCRVNLVHADPATIRRHIETRYG